MKEQLINYYKENVSVNALVFSCMRKEYNRHNYTFYTSLVSFFAAFVSSMFYSQVRYPFFVTFVVLVISIILFCFAHRAFNRKAKEIVRKKLKLIPSKKSWRPPEFDRVQSQMIRTYFKKNNMYEKWKIELLIEMLNQDKEKSKVPPLIPPSIFIGLTVPNFTQFLIYLYSRPDVKTYTLQGYIFMGVSLTTLLVIWLLALIMKKYQEVKEEVFLKEVIYRKSLIRILQDVLLTYEVTSK